MKLFIPNEVIINFNMFCVAIKDGIGREVCSTNIITP
jgi:hypothetical protein